MTLRANATSRRSRNAKSLSVTQTQDYDSESETAVTSTSGLKATVSDTKIGRRKLTSRLSGVSKSPGMSRSPGASKLTEVPRSPGVASSPRVSRSSGVSKASAASESDVVSRPPAASKSSMSSNSRKQTGSPATSKSPVTSASNNQQPSVSRKRHHLATVVKEEHLADEEADMDGSLQDQSPGCQRLLMREWLLKEVELNKIPGLSWLDKERKLIRIPWIHASKDGWSQDSHSKLFENWAIYTGKYDPSKQKPDPKRWKANFRCALNSLPDIKEEPGLSKKNGMDGYRVYRVDDAVDRKGHRKHKVLSRTATVESQKTSSLEQNQPLQPMEPGRTSPVPVASSSSVYANDFTDSQGHSIFILPPSGVFIACSAELIHDTVCSSDGNYTSLSNVVPNEDSIELSTAVDSQKVEMSDESVSIGRNSVLERDIVSLRNLDHNYFKVQIPTTVENFVDEDATSPAEQNAKTPRKNAPR